MSSDITMGCPIPGSQVGELAQWQANGFHNLKAEPQNTTEMGNC